MKPYSQEKKGNEKHQPFIRQIRSELSGELVFKRERQGEQQEKKDMFALLPARKQEQYSKGKGCQEPGACINSGSYGQYKECGEKAKPGVFYLAVSGQCRFVFFCPVQLLQAGKKGKRGKRRQL